MSTKPLIYESPDGGATVYARETTADGVGVKYLIQSNTGVAAIASKMNLWRKILNQAQEDAQLQHMVEQIEIYYHLKSQP